MIYDRSPTGRTYAVEPDLYDDGVRKDIILFTITWSFIYICCIGNIALYINCINILPPPPSIRDIHNRYPTIETIGLC